jgi:regulator of sirC expression with transglutaminase-like and TPR domain
VTAEQAAAVLVRLLRECPQPFPLDRAALLLAAADYGGLEVAPFEAQLDRYAERVAAAAGGPSGTQPRLRAAALRRVLFEEEGFHGNREAYYDVRNSYLHEVLTRKLGIPISLGLVMIGVGRRLGWPVFGINFPNHFLVGCGSGDEALPLDPFHGGLILGLEELEERWRLATGYAPLDRDGMLAPAEPGAVLVRMLNNIRLIHHRQRRYDLAAAATEKILLIQPGESRHQKELGYYLLAARDFGRAAAHLGRYLEMSPHAPDADVVRDHLAVLRERLVPPSKLSGFAPPAGCE